MHYAFTYPALLALTMLLTSCAGVTSTHKNIHSDLDSLAKQQSEMMDRGDAAGVASLYSSTAQILPPNEDLVTGQPAILKWWQTALSGPPATAKITSKEAESYGDTAWDTGTFLITAPDGKVLDRGKFVTIYKRENGKWKLYRDIFNSDMPAAKP